MTGASLAATLPPLTPARVLTTWSLHPGPAVAVMTAAALYLAGVRRLRRRGDRWATSRAVWWMVGLAVIGLATQSVLGVYDDTLVSVSAVQHMLLQMIAPAALASAAPVTLALRTLSTRPRRWLLALTRTRVARTLARPPVAFGVFAINLFVFYYTPFYEATLRYEWFDTVSHAHFVAVGFLFYWSILGLDPTGHQTPFVLRFVLVVGMAPLHVLLGIPIMLRETPLAPDYFLALGRNTPAELMTDVNTAGALLWAFGDVSSVVLIVGFVSAWARSDAREARRLDRALDRVHGTGPTMTPWWLTEDRGLPPADRSHDPSSPPAHPRGAATADRDPGRP